MNTKTVIRQLNLTKEGFEKIQQSVKKAESKTSGEIAICVTAESSDYSMWEFLAAFFASGICFGIMISFASRINVLLENNLWVNKIWYLPLIYGAAVLVTFVIFFWLFNIPFLDRIIIPEGYKSKKVSKKAFCAFAETGVYCTEKHNGILIYVSYLERQVRIIADKGISDFISDDMWQLIADSLVAELKKGNGVDGFCDAVEKCGDLLSEHFPFEKDDVNELPDGLLILED